MTRRSEEELVSVVKAPAGIWVIAILSILGDIYAIDQIMAIISGAGLVWTMVLGSLAAFAAFRIVAHIGLISLESWAWKAIIPVYVVGIVGGFVGFAVAPLWALLGLLISVAVLLYVYSKKPLYLAQEPQVP